MLIPESKLRVADNSGAKIAKLIGVLGHSAQKSAGLGDIVRVAVQKAVPRGMVSKHELCRAVVVRVHKESRREDGSHIRFDDNAVVLLDGDGQQPKGTRIFGPVANELRKKGFEKILSLAPEVI